MTRRLDWADFRAAELTGLDPMRTIAVLPLAAIEQHGPHLPTGTDTIIAQGMLARLRTDLPDDLDIRILPIQAIGKSNEHLYAPGTLSLTAETALKAWTEIALATARSGIRKIVLVNSHGGNADLMSIVARELRVRAGMLAAKCSWGAFGYPDGLFSETELRDGLHGGDIETSLMLAFAPHTVDMTRAEPFPLAQPPVPFTGPASVAWIASDLNTSGVVGEAQRATAAKGLATAAHQVAGFIGLLHKLRSMALPADPTLPPADFI